MKTVYRAKEVLCNQGVVELAKRGNRFLLRSARKSPYNPIMSEKPYQNKRIDNDFRWSFVEPFILEQETLIDIGCAQGFMVSQAADSDLLSLGVDVSSESVSFAQKNGDLKKI